MGLVSNQQCIVFLDRDGTINRNYEEGPVYKEELFELLPRAAQAIRLFNDLEIPTIVITNQGGINHKNRDFSWKTYRKIEEMMHAALAKDADAHVDDVYLCHHADYEECNCRKPETGLFDMVKEKYDFAPQESYIIGDSRADILAGKKLGITTILVKSGWDQTVAEKLIAQNQAPDHIFKDIYDAAIFIKSKVEQKNR
jgi:D-glycero-D-manno-heptose 1,7-bisphosphate phosphatase